MIKYLVAFASFIITSELCSQEYQQNTYFASDSITKKIKTSELEEITITAAPFQRNIGAVAGSISIIAQQELKASQQIDVKPLLEQIPGVQMQSGALNTARLTIRGVGSRTPYASNRIKAYFNEIPLTSGDGATIVEDLEINNINSIEVIKGPSSAFYGSGLGGVIVIRPTVVNNGLNAGASAQKGAFGLNKIAANVSIGTNQSFMQLAVANTLLDGYRQNSNYKRSNVFFNAGTKLGSSSVSVLINYIDLNAQIPSSIDEITYKNTPHSAASNWLAVKGFQSYKKWQTGLSVNSFLAHNLTNNINLYYINKSAYESRPFNILAENTNALGLKHSLSYKTSLISIAIGYEIFSEDYNWEIYKTIGGEQGVLLNRNNDHRYFSNIFLHSEFNITPTTFFSAGINYHKSKYITENQPQHSYPSIVSPRIGINKRIAPVAYWFASVGHGFSTPSPEETLLMDGTINRELKPEEGVNIESGFRASFLGNKIYTDITAYSIYINNLLLTMRDAEDVFYGENAGKTKHYGLESKLKLNITEPNISQHHLFLTIGHTLMRNKFVHFVQNNINYNNKNLPGLPSSIYNVTLTTQFNIGLSAIFNYSSSNMQYLNDSNSLKYGGHSLINTTFIYNPQFKALKCLTIKTGIQNLLDTKHASMILVNAPSFGTSPARYYYPGNPRNYYVSINFDL